MGVVVGRNGKKLGEEAWACIDWMDAVRNARLDWMLSDVMHRLMKRSVSGDGGAWLLCGLGTRVVATTLEVRISRIFLQ